MKGKGAGHDEHGRGVDVLEGQIAHELGLDDGTDVRKVGAEIVGVANGCAHCDGGLDLSRVFLGFA